MGGLLSAISGQFAKILILGTLFPVVILAALNIMLVAPLLPQTSFLPGLVSKIAVGEEKWPVVVFTFVVFVLSGLLYDLNTPIVRIYEGYPWRKSVFGRAFCRLQKYRLQRARSLGVRANELRAQWEASYPADPRLTDVKDRGDALDFFLTAELPDTESLFLPTRLGNVIRCFERYPYLAYGMDATIFWPRLVAKIDAGFATNIDQAKTAFDFMLNVSFLSALTCLLTITIGLAVPAPLEWHYLSPWIWRAILFALMAVAFYILSVNRALAWGIQVRGAFDLYRLDLLKALGYQQKPLTYQEERAIWRKLSGQIQYPDTKVEPLSYEDAPTRVIPFPSDVQVSVEREYSDQQPNLSIPVCISVKNLDPDRDVSSLTVVDVLPDGYAYVPDSISAPNDQFAVRKIAPLELYLGPIPRNETLLVWYLIKPAAGQGK